MSHALTFADLNLLGENTRDGHTFLLETYGEGLDWGNPQPIETWVRAMLQDGSIAASQGSDNRQARLTVRVSADDPTALAVGESALHEATLRRTTLEWTPPGDDAVTTVFEVLASNLEQVTDDRAEKRSQRAYGLRMTCYPFTRSVDKITTVLTQVTTTPDEDLVNACNTLTGWTGTPGRTLSLVGGDAVRLTGTPEFPPIGRPVACSLWLRFGGSINLTDATHPYLKFTVNLSKSPLNWTLHLNDGDAINPAARIGGKVWFKVPPGIYTSLTLQAWMPISAGDTSVKLTVHQIDASNVAGVQGTGRQMIREVPVAGSARAQGDLQVTHATDGLGDTILYTYPPQGLGDFSPALMQFRTGGGSQTADSTLISGSREPLDGGTPPTYTIPAQSLPAGAYRLLARMRSTSGTGNRTITWTATVAGKSTTKTASINFPVVNTWYTVAVEQMLLPPVALKDDSESTVVMTIASSSGMQLDTAWIYHEAGALTWVKAGSELSVSVESPTIDRPMPAVWAGDHNPGNDVESWGFHEFVPPAVTTHMVTSGAVDASLMLEQYPWWHTHAVT